MTYEEAKHRLQDILLLHAEKPNLELDEVFRVAIAALEKMPEYNALKERDTAKAVEDLVNIEPVLDEHGAYIDADTYVECYCPVCGEWAGFDDNLVEFCRECGQRLKLEDDNV